MSRWYKHKGQLFILAAILLVTLCVYLPALSDQKQFTNWDDPDYIIKQPLIKQLSSDSIAEMFSPSRGVAANYHPLTMLSLAVNYHFSELDPFGYSLTNVILHLLNTFLVFTFIYLLSGRNFFMGAVTALLFGIHPMHVESVAWLSERKDVLYAFFFFLSCIAYLFYNETNKRKFLWVALLCFILSCLSKAMAVILPVVLLLIDRFQGRKLLLKTLLEKIPFFFIALVIGILSLRLQSELAMNEHNTFTFIEKILFASYGFSMYVAKLFVPVGLSGFYPYHDLSEGIPGVLYLFPFIAIGIMLLPLYLFRTKPEVKKIYIFGSLLFLIALLPVLQLIAVGGAVMADRYTYISYVGVFFVIAFLAEKLFANRSWRITVVGSLLIFTGAFSFLAYERVQVWNNSEVFWTDVINKSDQYIEVAYLDRGHYYVTQNQHDKALNDFQKLANLGSKDAGVYIALGNEYVVVGRYEAAIEKYTKAMALDTASLLARVNRAGAYIKIEKYFEALQDLDILLSTENKYTERAKSYKQMIADEIKRINDTLADHGEKEKAGQK